MASITVSADPHLSYVIPYEATVPILLRTAAARLRHFGFFQGDWYPQDANVSAQPYAPLRRACSADGALYLSAGCDPRTDWDYLSSTSHVPEVAVQAEEALAQYLVRTGLMKPVYDAQNVIDTLATIAEWNDVTGRTVDEIVQALHDCAVQETMMNRN